MNGLKTLAFLAIKSSQAYPHLAYQTTPNSQLTVQKETVVPFFAGRLLSFSKGTLADNKHISTAENSTDSVRTIVFDETLCFSILSALLKQFGKKLNAVRCKAGKCLERLLRNDSPRLPFVPYYCMLVSALNLNWQPINWSNPAVTFPLLMCAANIEGFLEPILSEIVISVGGLTESVSKSSCPALFEWIREMSNTKATPRIFQMGKGKL